MKITTTIIKTIAVNIIDIMFDTSHTKNAFIHLILKKYFIAHIEPTNPINGAKTPMYGIDPTTKLTTNAIPDPTKDAKIAFINVTSLTPIHFATR